MLSKLRRNLITASVEAFRKELFSAPINLDEEVLRKRIYRIIFIRFSVLGILLAFSCIQAWSIISTTSDYAAAASYVGPLAIAALLSLYFLRQLRFSKRIRTLCYLQLLFDALVATFSIYLLGQTGCIFLYVLTIIEAAALLSSHGSLQATAVCGILFALISAGAIPSPDGIEISIKAQDFLIFYLAMLAVAVISSWAAKQLELFGKLAVEHAKNLEDYTTRQKQLFNDLNEGVITVDLESAITSINQAAQAIIGISQSDTSSFVGKPLPDILKQLGVTETEELLKLTGENPSSSEIILQSPDQDQEVCLHYVSKPLLDPNGNLTGRMFLFKDISRVKSIEQKLQLHEQMTKLLSADETDRPSGDSTPLGIGGIAKIIGQSAVMNKVFSLVERVAPSEVSVLISGESGTGKELIAKSIHAHSKRRSRPFVAVNCGAIPENLIESELFGHVKGAFTGAVRDNIGLFREASGGTIFLDEVGELPLHMQTKLLRVLQERTVKPVGGTQDINIDVRVLAATNKNLKQEVRAQCFREDLFYRLNVVNILIPPLRERKEDIPLLVRHFVGKISGPDGLLPKISPDCLQTLMTHNFPGNVRELENIIERALVLGKNVVLPEHLPTDLFSAESQEANSWRANGELNGSAQIMETAEEALPINLEEELARVERGFLEKALEKSGGVKKQAAELLGLNFRSFRYRLKKYELQDHK